jgi:vacuolar-type H+-ATPase subunit I/STV1
MPLDTKEISIQEMLRVRHRDAVLWKAESLWTNAMDVDSQAGAIEEITAMLMCMRQEAKRSSYISAIADEQNNRAKAHAKQVVGLEKEIEGCEKVVKRLQAKKKSTPEDDALLRDTLSHIKDVTTELDELKANVVAELQERILTAQVKTAVKEKKQRMEAMQMDAKLQQNIKSAADVGLPDDFKGNIKDILDAIKYGIYLHDNIYYSRGPKGDYAISNFTMKIFYHVKTGDENAFRLIAVKNVYGIEVTINMNTDDFVSLGSFKKVLARHGDFVFKGADSDLSRLQEYLQRGGKYQEYQHHGMA